MKAAAPFWDKIGTTTYTRQVAIIAQGGTHLTTGDDKDWVKSWYGEQSSHWGPGAQKVFKSWVQANKKDCLEFCKKFLKLLKGRYKGVIPDEVINKTLDQFKEKTIKGQGEFF